MSGKAGRSGRPKDPRLDNGYVATQVRLPPIVEAMFRIAIDRVPGRTKTEFFTQAAERLIASEKVTEADVPITMINALPVLRRALKPKAQPAAQAKKKVKEKKTAAK